MLEDFNKGGKGENSPEQTRERLEIAPDLHASVPTTAIQAETPRHLAGTPARTPSSGAAWWTLSGNCTQNI